MIALTRILVPTNLGEPSKAAVAYGVAFARQFNAQLFLLRVLSQKDFDAAIEAQRVVDALDGAAESDVDTIARKVAGQELRRLLSPGDERDARVEYILQPGPDGPHAAIASCAEALGIELVVMGKHRFGLVDQVFAGSVTERVVRQAPCPVLIVQHPQHDFVLPDDPGDGIA